MCSSHRQVGNSCNSVAVKAEGKRPLGRDRRRLDVSYSKVWTEQFQNGVCFASNQFDKDTSNSMKQMIFWRSHYLSNIEIDPLPQIRYAFINYLKDFI